MKFIKFLHKQGKTKESLPDAFDEKLEIRTVEKPVIPLSSLKAELIKCSMKAKEPIEFPIIEGDKYSKIELDCLDNYVTMYLPDGYDMKSYVPMECEDSEPPKYEDYQEYPCIEKKPDENNGGNYYTIFFGDFIKLLLNEFYAYSGVDKSFYDRLGEIPVVIDLEGKCEDPKKYFTDDIVVSHQYYLITNANGDALAYIYMKI